MYPEFNNEEIKDISTVSGTELEPEATPPEGDNVTETDMTSPDTIKEESENTPHEDIQQAEKEPQTVPSTADAEVLSEEPSKDAPTESIESAETIETTETIDSAEPIEPIAEEQPAELPSQEDIAPPAVQNVNYLLYGGKDVPEGVNYKDTLKFIVEQLKYDGGELRQARQNKDGSGVVNPEEKATEFCSYCGLPISGVDYYRLHNGRKRCTNCSRSLVKSLEDLNTVFNNVLLNMELFFGAVIDVPISVEMLEERKLKKKIGKGLGNPPKNALILGVAVEHKGKYTIYIENGIPRVSLISTLAHELTHIWQYTHWNAKSIKKKYGSRMRPVVYEGMAMWTEIQYLYHIGEQTIAKREEYITRNRNDVYGNGFCLYESKYPLSREAMSFEDTPFTSIDCPLD